MKKLILRIAIALVVLVIAAVVVMALSLNWVVRKGVQTVGGNVTKVDVKLQSVNLSLLSGAGEFKGLIVGNPPGFGTPWAINVGTLALAVEPRSLLSDKVVVRTVHVEAPEITFETDLRGNNLSKILSNMGGGGQPEPAKPAQPAAAGSSRKFELDDLLIKDAKLHVTVSALGGKTATVSLPEIHLQDLGKGPEGITAGELTRRILEAIEANAAQAAASSVGDIGNQAKNMARDMLQGGTNSLQNVTHGLGGFFKK